MRSDVSSSARDDAVEVSLTQIERFATHDGPGIRTTVFLKGCPLHCPWCANPEAVQLGNVLFHDSERCVACRGCEAACPEGAISFERESFSHDPLACVGCCACVRACLNRALALQNARMTVGEILDTVERDRDYFETSGGGVTFSGGEPLSNRAVIVALVRSAKRRALNVVVETTGNVSRRVIDEIDPYVDHYLFDFKHFDSEALREMTGGDEALIRANLRYVLDRDATRVHVHIPVIPGFNFEAATLRTMLEQLHEMGCLKVDLLPYHTLARAKVQKMGRTWWSDAEGLTDDALAPFHRYAQELGMESKIGA